MIEEQRSQTRVVLELKDYSHPPACSHCGRVYNSHGYSHPGLDIARDALSYTPLELLIPDIKGGWGKITQSVTHRYIHHRLSVKCDQQVLRFGSSDSFYNWSRYGFMLLRAAGLTYNEIQQMLVPTFNHASSSSVGRRALVANPDFVEMERLNVANRDRLKVAVEISESFPTIWEAAVSGGINRATLIYARLLESKSLEDPRVATLKLDFPTT